MFARHVRLSREHEQRINIVYLFARNSSIETADSLCLLLHHQHLDGIQLFQMSESEFWQIIGKFLP